MVDLYDWPYSKRLEDLDPLNEMELPYRVLYVNIGRSEQFKPEFTALEPAQRPWIGGRFIAAAVAVSRYA